MATGDKLTLCSPPPPHNNSNTLQNDVVRLDLSAVAKSTGKYRERFIVYRQRHRNVTEQVLNSGEEVAKCEVFRGVLMKASSRLQQRFSNFFQVRTHFY
jgi:hypothetical protein